MAVDTTVTLEGTVTVVPGRILGDRVIAIQDGSGGICVRLTADADMPSLVVGRRVRVTGKLAAPYANLEVRLSRTSDLAVVGDAEVPTAVDGSTTSLGEAREGQLLRLVGTLTSIETGSSGALALTLTDGEADARVFLHAPLGAVRSDYAIGSTLAATGIAGQRESASGLNDGYRLWPRDRSDIVVLADRPTPAPTATPARTSTPAPTVAPTAPASARPTATPVPLPSHTPTPTPRPTATPSPSPAAVQIAAARAFPVGAAITVTGTITAEPGRVLDDRVMVIQDASGGICIRLPSGVDLSPFTRGRIVTVSGALAAPYANLELRPTTGSGVAVVGSASVPAPMTATASSLGEPLGGRLARLTGVLTRIETGSSGSLALILTSPSGGAEARVFFFASASATRADYALGAAYAATGIVGQRESATGLNDGYRLWPRDRSDVVQTAAAPSPTAAPTSRPTATPRPTPTASPRPTGSAGPSTAPTVSITEALRRPDATVVVVGVTTTRAGLLDADSRRVTIQDATAAILVRLPADSTAPPIGTRIRVIGKVGTYYGAPQMEVESPAVVVGHQSVTPLLLRRVPAAHDEWMLIRVTARIDNVTRNGDSWRAEVSLGAGGSMPVAGLASSGIPSTALVEGRSATLTGIVKRAYPTASDQRFALVPRSGADIQLGSAPGPSPTPAGTGAGGGRSPGARSLGVGSFPPYPRGSAQASGRAAADDSDAVPTTIDGLPGLVGQRVRVGGRVINVEGPVATIADGTGETSVRFASSADAATVDLTPDELVNVVGWDAERDLGGLEVVVTAAGDVSHGPDLGAGGSADPGAGESQGIDASAEASSDPELQGAGAGTNGTAAAVGLTAALLAALGVAGAISLAGSAAYLRRRRHTPRRPTAPSGPASGGGSAQTSGTAAGGGASAASDSPSAMNQAADGRATGSNAGAAVPFPAADGP